MEIIWSVASEKSYLNIIEQLFDTWGIEFVEKFESQVNKLIENLTTHNYFCPKSSFLDLRKCVINKHISLIYRIANKKKIEIVILIFNKSEPVF